LRTRHRQRTEPVPGENAATMRIGRLG
jgi:hypothetical protein